MKINLKCFATLSEHETCDYKDSKEYEISNGETVKGLVNHLGISEEEAKIVFVNGKKMDLDAVLHDGDQVGLAPATGGM
jgi:molybdopterin converting factor small subunit